MGDASHAHVDESGLGPDPTTVRSVLAIRTGGVADVVRALPALRHLRSSYAGAVITVAAPATARELLQACPWVDRVVDAARPAEALVERFDVAVSWARPGQSGLDVDDVDAGFRASWRAAGAPERRSIHPAWPDRLDDSTRMLRLAWLLGGEVREGGRVGLWPSLADRNGAARLVAEAQRPIALLHVGSGRRERRWQPAGWAAVVDLLDDAGLEPVVIGTARDRRVTAEALEGVRHAPLNLVGRTAVGELCGLLERAALFVGTDSGPAAMAGALGVRSVIVGPESPYEHESRPGAVDLVDPGPCTTCGERACTHGPRPAGDVPLDQALARVELAAVTALERWRRSHIA